MTDSGRIYAKKLAQWDTAAADTLLSPLSPQQRDALTEISKNCITSKLGGAKSNEPDVVSPMPVTSIADFHNICMDIESNGLPTLDETVLQKRSTLANMLLDDIMKMIDQIDDTLRALEMDVKPRLAEVGERGHSLDTICRHATDGQKAIASVVDKIERQLLHFTSVDRVAHQLASLGRALERPSASRLVSPSRHATPPAVTAIIQLLDQIDESYRFVLGHPQYCEHAAYIIKWRGLLAEACELITNAISKSLAEARSRAMSVGNDEQNVAYTAFEDVADEWAPLLRAVEGRAYTETECAVNETYKNLLSNLICKFIDVRETLISPAVSRNVTDDTQRAQHSGKMAMIKAGSVFLRRLCSDEIALFRAMFPLTCADDSRCEYVLKFIQRQCSTVYDSLRALVIHVDFVVALTSLLEVVISEVSVGIDSYLMTPYQSVLLQLQADVEERLVYRFHVQVDGEVRDFSGIADELTNYDARMRALQSVTESLSKELKSPTSVNMSEGIWYTPVRRTLLLINQLVSVKIDQSIFQGLASYTVAGCLHAIAAGARHLATSNKEQELQYDSSLFAVKHILLLRESTYSLLANVSPSDDIGFHLDFQPTVDATSELVRRASVSLTNIIRLDGENALVRFVIDSLPQVSSSANEVEDGKLNETVDIQLRDACNEFVDKATFQLVGQLKRYVKHVKGVECNPDPLLTTEQQETVALLPASVVAEMVRASIRTIKSATPVIRSRLHLFLGNPATEKVLFKPVLLRVQGAYKSLAKIVLDRYSPDDQLIIACPSIDEVAGLMNQNV